ncbi:hypothetical protein C7N43_25325 [Sphingobacteriales bacterium UPWRP_1]|nr:hypothetical protein BVG80_17480 [Sphingobacteriales bacterium TSM_CSM]PSJ74167.1 hypothetical protein C7N43_25325 [Sphingobacteriales bacterium UPWRP_1]
MKEPLTEGLDYYIDEQGRWVFTQHYLLKRGYCCQNGCRHCPYGFEGGDKLKTSGSLPGKRAKKHLQKG